MIRRLRSTLSSKRDAKVRMLLLLKKKCKEKSVSFDTSEWDRGMYILNVIQDKNVKSLKLIVK